MKMEGVVLICDGVPDTQNETINQNGVSFSKEIPVTYGQDESFGKSVLYWEGNKLVAKIVLSNPFPKLENSEKLIKILSSRLIPSVCGAIINRDPLDHNVITECVITCISLHLTPNADRRITSLKECTDENGSQ